MANIKIKEGYAVTFNTSNDESTDYIEYFKTLDAAKEFATALLEGDEDAAYNAMGGGEDYECDYVPSDVDKTTLQLFKLQLIGKPKITLKFD